MMSTFSISKIEDLQHFYDIGMFDSAFIYEQLETLNQINRQEYIKKNAVGWNFETFRRNSEKFVATVYDECVKDWKQLKKEYWNNKELNLLPQSMKEDFQALDRFLSDVVVCKKVVSLWQFTKNPVQISYEESLAIKNIMKNHEKLAYFIFEYQV